MPRFPNLFLIGAPKSGTTSLHRYLGEHPEVFMSRIKEPGYFAPDVVSPRVGHLYSYPDGEPNYLDLFADGQDMKRVGESSTSYLMSIEAPKLICEHAPESRFIAMVRNPVDLIHSLHNERVSGGSEWITDFAEAIDADDDRRAGKRLPRHHYGWGVAYRDNARMGDHLERWMTYFSRERLHIMVFDDFSADTPGEFAKVLAFLGIDSSFRPESFDVYNASHKQRGGLRRMARPVLRNPLSKWLSGRALPALVGVERRDRMAKRFGARRLTKQTYEREPMQAHVRTQLEREFTGDVRKLGDLIGRDLTSEWFGVSDDRSSAPAER